MLNKPIQCNKSSRTANACRTMHNGWFIGRGRR